MQSLQALENKVMESDWWHIASNTVDSHYSNESGIMLSNHLLAVYNNVERIFNHSSSGFYGNLFKLLPVLQLDKNTVKEELKLVALLHDIGKPKEEKTLVIPHPLTGKDAHKRHGLVALMATMEILGDDLAENPDLQKRIYRTVELHDMSYGLYREYNNTGSVPLLEKWNYINDKMHQLKGGGLMYLLLFKLADIHGHSNLEDVIWFYQTAHDNYFKPIGIDLPVPKESDIRIS
jgi:hypothetical protein